MIEQSYLEAVTRGFEKLYMDTSIRSVGLGSKAFELIVDKSVLPDNGILVYQTVHTDDYGYIANYRDDDRPKKRGKLYELGYQPRMLELVGKRVEIVESGSNKLNDVVREFKGRRGECIGALTKQKQLVVRFEDGECVSFRHQNVVRYMNPDHYQVIEDIEHTEFLAVYQEGTDSNHELIGEADEIDIKKYLIENQDVKAVQKVIRKNHFLIPNEVLD